MSMGSTSLPPPTADELARWAAATDKGCVVCVTIDGATATDFENHHLLSRGGLRLGHRFTVCLCQHHHAQVKTRTFKKHFPDEFLLRRQDRMIGWPEIELPAKRARNPARSRCTAAANQVKRPASGFA